MKFVVTVSRYVNNEGVIAGVTVSLSKSKRSSYMGMLFTLGNELPENRCDMTISHQHQYLELINKISAVFLWERNGAYDVHYLLDSLYDSMREVLYNPSVTETNFRI